MLNIWLLKVTPFMLGRAAERKRVPRDIPSDFMLYGSCRGMVVVAEGEREARSIAHVNDDRAPWWLDPALTTCELVSTDTEYVVLKHVPIN